ILLGIGDGQFAPYLDVPVGMNPYGIAVADVNGDQKLDLIVANGLSNNVSILLGAGDGQFNLAATMAVGTYPSSVAVGDFNGDGKPDLAVANLRSNNVSILLGTGTGQFTPAPVPTIPVGANPSSIAVGDFNRDNKLDLAVVNQRSNSVSILLGMGDGRFTAA